MISLSSERQGGIGFSSGKKMEVLATVVVYFKPITIQYLAEVNGLVDDMNACNIYSLILTPIFDLTSSECKEVCPPSPAFVPDFIFPVAHGCWLQGRQAPSP